MYEPVDTIRWSSPNGPSDEQDGISNNTRHLPAEVLQMIMKCMDSKELLLCRRINNTWNESAEEVLKRRATSDWQLYSCSPSYIPRNNRSVSFYYSGHQNAPIELVDPMQEEMPSPRASVPTGCVIATIDSSGYKGFSNYVENAGHDILSFTCQFENFNRNHEPFICRELGLGFGFYPIRYITTFLLDILSKMPNLQKLAINKLPLIGFEDEDPFLSMSTQEIPFPALPNLKYLGINSDTFGITNNVALNLYCRSIVRSYGTTLITFKCQYNLLNTLYIESMSLPFKNLRALKLKINFYHTKLFDNVKEIFSHIPKLEYLWVQSDYVAFVELLTKLDQVNWPLKQIHFDVNYQGNDEPPGDEMRPVFLDEHFHQCLEIKRGIRKMKDYKIPATLITRCIDMIPKNKTFEKVQVVTLPWLQSTSYWRQGGVKSTLKMFPNSKILSFTQCNYWTCRFVGHSTKKRYPDYNPDHNKIVTNLITEFKGDGRGLEFFKLLPKLKKVQFFPDCESADRDAFITYTKNNEGNIKTESNGQVPLDLKRFEYPINDDGPQFDVIILDSDDDDDVLIID